MNVRSVASKKLPQLSSKRSPFRVLSGPLKASDRWNFDGVSFGDID